MRDDFKVWCPIEVRWADMDSYSHVNNAKYFTYCESARFAYFQKIDMESFRAGTDHGPALVSATCNFRKQVHYPASLEVGARASKAGRSSFTLEYEIFYAGTEEIVADGSSVVVWVDYAAGKSTAMPTGLRQRISELDGLD